MTTRKTTILTMALLATLGSERPASQAQPLPLGREFQVNSQTAGAQNGPDLALLPDGSFIVAWTSASSTGTDQDGSSIHTRRFDRNGQPLADDNQINLGTEDDQFGVSVSANERGRFVVSWNEPGYYGIDQYFDGHARLFESNGTPQTLDLDVVDHSVTAMMPSGVFVISDFDDGGYPAGVPSLTSRLHDSQGQFVVAVPHGAYRYLDRGALAARHNEGLFLALISDEISGAARIHRFGGDGATHGVPLLIEDDPSTFPLRDTALTVARTDRFAAVWRPNGGDIMRGQAFSATGVASPAFDVNPGPTSLVRSPDVAMAAGGDLLVVWRQRDLDLPGGPLRVWGAHFEADGLPLGDAFRVDSGTVSVSSPVVESSGETFVVLWSSTHSVGDDTDDESVHARRYASPVTRFHDAFESAGLTDWSNVVP